jgi:hypothetical protein
MTLPRESDSYAARVRAARVVDDGSVALALHGMVAWGAEAINRMDRDSPLFPRLLELQEQLEGIRNEWVCQ